MARQIHFGRRQRRHPLVVCSLTKDQAGVLTLERCDQGHGVVSRCVDFGSFDSAGLEPAIQVVIVVNRGSSFRHRCFPIRASTNLNVKFCFGVGENLLAVQPVELTRTNVPKYINGTMEMLFNLQKGDIIWWYWYKGVTCLLRTDQGAQSYAQQQ